MKILTIILLISFFSIAVIAQDTTYYKEIIGAVDRPTEATYYEVITNLGDSIYTKETYNIDNTKTALNTYSNDSGILHGERKEWYKTGQLFYECTYVNGKKDGEFNAYWTDGSIERTEQYNNGKLISANCFNKKGKKTKCDDFMKGPEFPGGDNALYKFLANNMQYPQVARETGIQGIVYLTFDVEVNGEVTNIKVLRGIGGGCDEECIRIVEMMPQWIPASIGNKPVRLAFNLPIKFTLSVWN